MSAYDDALSASIAQLYAGPLDDFVRRRDALARELRGAGDREGALAVKALRKPARSAWALNLCVTRDDGGARALSAAVAATLAAQASGGDVRAALAALRTAIRDFAARASAAAAESGVAVAPAALVNALLAVLGTPDHFEQLRAGRLADVPDAGGLDFLAGLPAPAAPVSVPVQQQDAEGPDADADAAAAARETAQAARARDEARRTAESARQALRESEAELEAAQARVRRAEEEAASAREQHARALRRSQSAAAEVEAADRAVAAAERRLEAAARRSP